MINYSDGSSVYANDENLFQYSLDHEVLGNKCACNLTADFDQLKTIESIEKLVLVLRKSDINLFDVEWSCGHTYFVKPKTIGRYFATFIF